MICNIKHFRTVEAGSLNFFLYLVLWMILPLTSVYSFHNKNKNLNIFILGTASL